MTSRVNPSSDNVNPAITFVAIFASGTPVALLTNGMVLDALGFTSRTNNSPSLMAYWTFISPITLSSFAIALVAAIISSISKALSRSLNSLLNLESIDDELNKLVNQFNCRYAILYTDSGIIISDHYLDAMDIREFEEKISSKISEDLEFFQRLKDQNVNIDDRIAYSSDRTDYVKKFSIFSENKENTLYVGLSTTINSIYEIKIELEKLRKVLQTSFA